MARTRPKVSAKEWVDKPDSGFASTVLRTARDRLFLPKKEGSYRLEIIPYQTPARPGDAGPNPNAEAGDWHYERTFYMHRDIGPDNNAYVCPRKTAGKACPICDYRDKLEKQRDADEDMITALIPKQRQLWNVFDHDDADKGIQVWEVSFHNFGKQLKKEIRNADEGDGYEYFADPEDGMTLKVYLEETSFSGGNTFLQTSSISFKPRQKPLPDEIFDNAVVLDEELIVYDYDKLRTIFLQEEPEDNGDGAKDKSKEKEEDEKPATRREEPKREKPKDKPKPKTLDDMGLGKGDEVEYKGKVCTIIKVLDEDLCNLLDENDDLVKGVAAEDLRPHRPEKKEEPKQETKPVAKDEDEELPFADEPAKETTAKADTKETAPAPADDDDAAWDQGWE